MINYKDLAERYFAHVKEASYCCGERFVLLSVDTRVPGASLATASCSECGLITVVRLDSIRGKVEALQDVADSTPTIYEEPAVPPTPIHWVFHEVHKDYVILLEKPGFARCSESQEFIVRSVDIPNCLLELSPMSGGRVASESMLLASRELMGYDVTIYPQDERSPAKNQANQLLDHGPVVVVQGDYL